MLSKLEESTMSVLPPKITVVPIITAELISIPSMKDAKTMLVMNWIELIAAKIDCCPNAKAMKLKILPNTKVEEPRIHIFDPVPPFVVSKSFGDLEDSFTPKGATPLSEDESKADWCEYLMRFVPRLMRMFPKTAIDIDKISSSDSVNNIFLPLIKSSDMHRWLW